MYNFFFRAWNLCLLFSPCRNDKKRTFFNAVSYSNEGMLPLSHQHHHEPPSETVQLSLVEHLVKYSEQFFIQLYGLTFFLFACKLHFYLSIHNDYTLLNNILFAHTHTAHSTSHHWHHHFYFIKVTKKWYHRECRLLLLMELKVWKMYAGMHER